MLPLLAGLYATKNTRVLSQNISITTCTVQAHLPAASMFQLASICPLKSAPSSGGCEPPSNAWFLGPTLSHPPNGNSIDSAIFAQLTRVSTYTQTKLPTTSVATHCMQAMWPLKMLRNKDTNCKLLPIYKQRSHSLLMSR